MIIHEKFAILFVLSGSTDPIKKQGRRNNNEPFMTHGLREKLDMEKKSNFLFYFQSK